MGFTTSPNMQLQVPIVGNEPGPLYATDVNNSLNIIDGHNHSAGSGVLITPAGLNINADLPINGNNLTLVNSIRYTPVNMPIPNSSPNIAITYVSGNELYYNDFSGGHQVQITNNGNVNAGAGSITGLPSGTASVTFASSIYVFQSSTNVAATVDVASVILRNTTPSSFGLTLSPPSLGSNYNITLPTLPGVTSVLTLDTAGNMGTATYDQIGQNMTSVGANAIAASMNNANFGGSSTTVNGKTLIVGETSENLALVRFAFGSAGNSQFPGASVVKTSTGSYTVTFGTAFSDVPAVLAAPTNLTTNSAIGAGNVFSVQTVGISASSLNVLIFNGSGVLTDCPAAGVAIGPR